VAAVATATATEDGALVTGSVSSTDVDVLGQTASYALDAPVAGLTMDADGTYSFNPGDAAYQSLAEGEELQWWPASPSPTTKVPPAATP
jgi:hypothetical protein